ncbi:hypothetical protein [Winogradskyella sp. SYSU M77433]|uniref:hypothetical protein n=1 Tax=Winogradskyella sp. SYSU M77433 TaxID=3042722 RepID=UPI002480CA0A|nr:hypothetical protein [Winogradskyella sp. SYSU M77433]MDH7912786.1 hypothetical protein [Winogradskyella sp. SYSU M77433]
MILRKTNPAMNENEYLNRISDSNANFLNTLIENNFVLPNETPVEIHPYKNDLPLENFDNYIIGTFPPISYLNDNILLNNEGLNTLHYPNGRLLSAPGIPFYHGNTRDISLWQYILDENLFNHVFEELNRLAAKDFLINYLQDNRINYSDIIYSTKRKKYSPSDSCLGDIVINDDLLKHILTNNNVTRLLFNTASAFSKSGIKIHQNNGERSIVGRVNVNNTANSFDLFFRALQDRNCTIEFRVENDNWIEVNVNNRAELSNTFSSKIIFKAKIVIPARNDFFNNEQEITKEIYVVTPFSPAARGRVNSNPVIQNWRQQNNNQDRSVLLKLIYQSFLRFNQEDLTFLHGLNVE